MCFQIPSQASLHGILKTHRSLASRAALLWRRYCREGWLMAEEENHLEVAGNDFERVLNHFGEALNHFEGLRNDLEVVENDFEQARND